MSETVTHSRQWAHPAPTCWLSICRNPVTDLDDLCAECIDAAHVYPTPRIDAQPKRATDAAAAREVARP